MIRLLVSALTGALLMGCSGVVQPPATERLAASPVASESAALGSQSWIKERFISVEDAVARLEPNVDVPVVLPDTKSVYLPRLGKWMADPKYLSWDQDQGIRYGNLKLVHKEHILLLDFGLVTFDGCGGTDFHIPTYVADDPALVYIARGEVWSSIVWPMRPLDTTGTFGLSGTVEGWQARLLAESMAVEADRITAQSSC